LNLLAVSPSEQAVELAFDHPAPNMGRSGNTFELSGAAVWRLLRGDWFDAAVTYRDWVRKEAKSDLEQGLKLVRGVREAAARERKLGPSASSRGKVGHAVIGGVGGEARIRPEQLRLRWPAGTDWANPGRVETMRLDF
jgi:hypothetical protein